MMTDRLEVPPAAAGGNLGQFWTGQTAPEFEETLAGELSRKPVATRYGFHVAAIAEHLLASVRFRATAHMSRVWRRAQI